MPNYNDEVTPSLNSHKSSSNHHQSAYYYHSQYRKKHKTTDADYSTHADRDGDEAVEIIESDLNNNNISISKSDRFLLASSSVTKKSAALRVLICTESFHPYTSGIARRFKEIIRRLAKRNFLIHIVTGCKVEPVFFLLLLFFVAQAILILGFVRFNIGQWYLDKWDRLKGPSHVQYSESCRVQGADRLCAAFFVSSSNKKKKRK